MARKKHSTEHEKFTTVRKFDTIFSCRLSDLLKEKGDKIGKGYKNKISKELGVSRRIIELWEGRQARPAIDRLPDLAEYFDVTVDYLVGRTDTRAKDIEMTRIRDITGLSEKAIECLTRYNITYEKNNYHNEAVKKTRDFINDLVEYLYLPDITHAYYNYKQSIERMTQVKLEAKSFIDSWSDLSILKKWDSYSNTLRTYAKAFIISGFGDLTFEQIASHEQIESYSSSPNDGANKNELQILLETLSGVFETDYDKIVAEAQNDVDGAPNLMIEKSAEDVDYHNYLVAKEFSVFLDGREEDGNR